MSNPFATPAPPGEGIKWADHKDKLLIIEPIRVQEEIQTSFGETDAVAANVWVLTGPDTHDTYEDTLVFPRVLQGQLRKRLGEKVLGRLTQGQAKPGQSAPWMLAEATADDITKGVAALERIKAETVTAPTPVTAGAAPAAGSDEVPF